MSLSLGSRLKHAWDIFRNKDSPENYMLLGAGYGYRPDRVRLSGRNERSIVTAIYNRIAVDVSGITINHVRLDENGSFSEIIKSGLNNCLTMEANADQTGRAFIQDVVMSMLDEGCAAIVPVETTFDPEKTGSYDIASLRTGKILDWYPYHVRVRLYDERTGQKREIVVPKKIVAIIENPFYAVMNEPNSTMQRLIRKLNLLDIIDEQSGFGKLDLIIQLPYIIRSEARRKQAEQRRRDIEDQLSGTKYGIAYTDGTEHITQLNRPVENNLMKQIEYLTNMLFSQLGITQSILDGTADDKTMLNYYNQTLEPILSAITDEIKRKFLTKTARSKNQSIKYFRDPFKNISINEMPEMADKFTRNEIMSSNEMRQKMGLKPSDAPAANELRNKNLNAPSESNQTINEEKNDTDNEKSEFLVHADDGKKFTYNNYCDSYWDPVMELIDAAHKPHDTRHTCISLLSEKEVSPTIIKKIVGHSGAMSLTERVYTHVNVQELLDAINKI